MSDTQQNTRVERDTMGEVHVPADAYYGAQTQRAVENFPISGQPLHPALIRAIGRVKYACGVANNDLGKLTGSGKNPLNDDQVQALLSACQEVADGQYDDQFPIDVYQTGSGTSSNMNANEVIANRAIEITGGDRFAPSEENTAKPIHPNDHVNMGQSTNDTFPTAIHVAVATTIWRELMPALYDLRDALESKSQAWDHVIKIGRTHLADATPLRLGQEFGGFAQQLDNSVIRAGRAIRAILELPVGGTAVGTGINTHEEFGRRVAAALNVQMDDDFREEFGFEEAADHFEANSCRDGLVEAHGQLKTIATTLFHVANAVRWLGSGPRCAFNEVIIPDLQPGSSIMPGKVNPVMSESLMQVCARVIGHDGTMTISNAAGGNFQLNIMMPVLGNTILESIQILTGGVKAFTDNCIRDLEANEEKCKSYVEQSLAMVTSLNPHIGYEKAAALAKEAFKTGKTIRELCEEQNILPIETLNEALNPMTMTEPG